jgi:hypothetical protein
LFIWFIERPEVLGVDKGAAEGGRMVSQLINYGRNDVFPRSGVLKLPGTEKAGGQQFEIRDSIVVVRCGKSNG